ncbi:hypothetical protein C8F01DRAFT_1124668 [Mycena amicta]|nr:hypothetical protein C8F01DRAFT_1124668 [Mycena amicta]
MSTGVVRSSRRSAARSAQSKPYARPAPERKSPWAIATGLLSFLNPLRTRPQTRSDSSEDDEEPEVERAAPQNLSARGRQMAQRLPSPAPEPVGNPTPYLLPDSSSLKQNLETVASFLDQRRGQTITPLEAEGLISLIQKSTPADKPEPFRFSSSASLPSTPARGNSPVTPTNDLFTLGTSNSTPAVTPRRTLSKNPNGVYRWSGGGSARPSKNRYASPAFGTPSRPSSPHLVFRDSPAADSSPKRRRLETPSPATPPPVPRSAAPAPSPTRVATQQNLATPGPSPATPSRPINKVKSVPVVPSPLRQAWGSSPASSLSSSGSSPVLGAGTPTKAASLLTALIRDADAEIPKRFADVRNPYQAASPVSVRVTNTHPPETASRKRSRVTGRANKEEAEKAVTEREKQVIPPQAIIEATMPKGSKRSRPPAHINGNGSLFPPSQPSPRRSPRLGSQRIDEEDEAMEKEEEEREAGAPATKRTRLPALNGSLGNGNLKKDEEPRRVNGTEEKVVESPVSAFPVSNSAPSLLMGSNTSNATSAPLPSSTSELFRAGPKPLPNVPKEPSKLRYSFAPPPTPPPLTEKSAKAVDANSSVPSTSTDPKEAARSLASSALPTFVFSSITNAPSVAAHAAAREVARKLTKNVLPTFVFAAPSQDKGKGKAVEGVGSVSPKFEAVCEAPCEAPITAPAATGFNWAAAGAKKPEAATDGDWVCGTCMLKNPATLVDKCGVCDSPR